MFAESLPRCDLRLWDLPDAAPSYEVRMLRHPSADGDAAHAWLRGAVQRLFRRRERGLSGRDPIEAG